MSRAEPGSRRPQGPSLHLIAEHPMIGVLRPGGADADSDTGVVEHTLAEDSGWRLVDLGDGRRLLWAPDSRPVADLPPGPAARVGVFVSPRPASATGEQPLDRLGRRVAAARRTGLLDPAAAIVVVGGEACPGAWGFQSLAAGQTVDLATCGAPEPRRPARTLVLGGAASGKSAYGELLLAPQTDVTYAATGRPPAGLDPEWDAKVFAHRARRPDSWSSLEVGAPQQLAPALARASGHLLWDSTGSWLTAVLDICSAWDGAPGWREQLDLAVANLVEAYRTCPAVLVTVAEEVGWGVVPPTASGRLFQHELGRLNQRLAAVSDAVHLVVAGRVLDLTKGLP